MHRDRRHSTRARVSFSSARRRSALSTSFPPLFAHALFVHTSILATKRGGSELAGASPSAAAAARISASARAAATAKTRAARARALRRLALGFGHDLLGHGRACVYFVSFVYAFAFVRSREERRGVRRRRVRVFFPRRGVPPSLSVSPSAGSLDALPRVPEHQHASDRERGERRGRQVHRHGRGHQRGDALPVPGVAQADARGHVPAVRARAPRRARTENVAVGLRAYARGHVPAVRARAPRRARTENVAVRLRAYVSAGGARRGRRDARARRRRGERCRETGHGDRSVCGTTRSRRRASVARVGVMRTTVTMTLS